MTTLTQPTVSLLLDRLFAEADASENLRRRERTTLSPEQRTADRADYRQFYARMKDQPLPVSPETGKLLYLLARSVRARTIVEFGTSFGISTLHLAAALRDNGGGRLIGSEFEPSKISRARANLVAGSLLRHASSRPLRAIHAAAVILRPEKSLLNLRIDFMEPLFRAFGLILIIPDLSL